MIEWIRRTPWNLTTKEYLDQHFQDQLLKAVLASQWINHGSPPSQSPFPLHALTVTHYLDGGYYPEGGAGAIAESVERIVKASGGQFQVSREVTEILLENGRAVGVRVRKTNATDSTQIEEYRAPVIVSNAGAVATYLQLVPAGYPIPFRDDLREFVEHHPQAANVTLYLGLSKDPRSLGFHGENHWLYDDCDHDATSARAVNWIEDGGPPVAYLSFPSLKDPQAEAHTAEIIAPAAYEAFAAWREQPWRNRGADYQALKKRISEALLACVEHHYPGFVDLVEYQELSTPLTTEYFTGHFQGGIYGIPCVAARFQRESKAWTHPCAPVAGLYQTGVDVGCPGIVGALMGGVTTLSHLPNGVSTLRVFFAARRARPAS